MIKIISALITIFCLAACSGKGDVREYYGPADTTVLEFVGGKGALIRTYYCDIFFENIRHDEWKILHGYRMFRGNGAGYPLEAGFHVIVENTWKKPIKVEKIEIISGRSQIKEEDFREMRDEKYMSDRYSIDMEKLRQPRRLLTGNKLLKNIDFYDMSVKYNFDFIAPGDTVSRFYLFSHVPYGEKKFKIRVTIKYLKFKKVIDFDMRRFEYREKVSSEEIIY